MSVRLKYAGDKSISGGRAGGFSIFVLPSVAGFPEAGTILSTQYLLRPINDGGSYVSDPNGGEHANAIHTVNQLADGDGGSYLDWANSVFANYITGNFWSDSGTSYLEINGVQYNNGSYGNQASHDGVGGVSYSGSNSYASYGDYIVGLGSGQEQISTPVGNFTYYSYSDSSAYHDGSGGYYVTYNDVFNAQNGDYIGDDGTSGNTSVEVPSTSGIYFTSGSYSSTSYYYGGASNYYTSYQGTLYNTYGDFITNDGTYDYYHDGNGGYYT